MAAPLVYLLTAATYVASTWAIWRIRTPEPTPVRSDATLGAQIHEGLAFVRGQRILYPLFSCIAAGAFASAGIRVLLPLLVLRTLSMSATQLGLLLSAGAIGGFLGALTRPVWIAHLGIGRTLVITNIIGVLVIVAQPASIHAPGMAAWIIAVSGVASSYFLTVYNVTQMSLRQEICPPDMLGRMNAIFRFAVWGVMPLGSLASGVVASWAGVEATMYIFTATSIAAGIAMGFTPAARIRGASATDVS